MICTCAHCGASIRRYGAHRTYFCSAACRSAFAKNKARAEQILGVRKCPHCDMAKGIAEFYKNPLRLSGYASWCKTCESVAGKKRRALQQPEIRREVDWKDSIKHRYGLTPAGYQALLEAQYYCCAVCEDIYPPGTSLRLCVDHDHDTGKVRGLICRRCNNALGLLKEDHVIVQKAALYLRKHSPHTRELRLREEMAKLDARLPYMTEKESMQGAVLKLAEQDR